MREATLGSPAPAARRGLLSYADQVRLAKAMEAGREAEERLDATRRLSGAERRRLEALAEQGDDARRDLVEAHAPLVLTEARRYAGSDRRTVVELVQQGNIGLVRAVDSFDWRRGARLGAYAAGWIRLAITSDRSDLPNAEDLRPAAEVVSLYRDRVASIDAGGGVADTDGSVSGLDRLGAPAQPAALTEAAIGRSPAPSGPMP